MKEVDADLTSLREKRNYGDFPEKDAREKQHYDRGVNHPSQTMKNAFLKSQKLWKHMEERRGVLTSKEVEKHSYKTFLVN